MSLFLGRPINGEPEKFFIEPFHTLIAGQTNLSGKTTTAIALASEAVKQGYTVLFFDTKPTTREFEGFHDIPVCYQPTTDPLVLIGLLEAIRHARLNPLYATLGRICEGAKNVQDIIDKSVEVEQSSRSGFIKDACYTLRDLLTRLQAELAEIDLSDKVLLHDKAINVMPVNQLSNEAQQLVLKTALEFIFRHHNRNTIVVVDEAFRFFPEQFGSACLKQGLDVITQGAKTHLFLWVSTQYISTTKKAIMKPCANKILGRQDETNEVEAIMKLVPNVKKLITADQIMTLRRGEFIFVPLEGKTVTLHVVPLWERGPMKRAGAIGAVGSTLHRVSEQPRPLPVPDQAAHVQPPVVPVPMSDPVPESDRKPVPVLSTETVPDRPGPQVYTATVSKPVIETLKSVPILVLPPDVDHPRHPMGRLAVILKDDPSHALNWTPTRAEKKFAEKLWPNEGLKEAFDQFIAWEIFTPQSNKTWRADLKRLHVTVLTPIVRTE